MLNMNNKICYYIFMMLLLSVSYAFGQNYNQDKTALTNFLVRMYENTPFDGVKAVEIMIMHILCQ